MKNTKHASRFCTFSFKVWPIMSQPLRSHLILCSVGWKLYSTAEIWMFSSRATALLV